jgi:twitching motility protein PilT
MHAHPAHTHAGPNGELARAARWSIDVEASDLVLVDGQPIAAKVHGAMLRQGSPLGEGAVAAMIDEALDGHARARLAEHGSVDLALGIDVPGAGRVRFRCNRFRALAGDSAVLRRISGEPPTLESLDLPPTLSRWAEEPWGLVLVCGPAGSGKSTTLVALVEHLNRTADKHIVTLEDPIEHVFAPKRSVIHQRSIGEHVESFGAGLRAALREAPDVILLGEMRDREAIGAAIVAAETGHLVLATVHAGSAAATIDRMLDVFSEHAQRTVRGQIAEVLRCVIGQRLLPARDGGRVPAVELMPTTAAIGHLIREGKTFQIPQLMQTGRDQGMVPMARSIADRVRSGRVDRATAMRLAPDPAALVDARGGR